MVKNFRSFHKGLRSPWLNLCMHVVKLHKAGHTTEERTIELRSCTPNIPRIHTALGIVQTPTSESRLIDYMEHSLERLGESHLSSRAK